MSRRQIVRPAAALAVSLLAGLAATAQQPASVPVQSSSSSADVPLPTDPRPTQGEFVNGMRYIVMKHAVPPGRVAAWLHVSTGSLNETDRQRGIAHFLEHMAFNGSTNFPPGTVIDFFQSLGLTFGRHQNASTGFDRTNYRLEMPDNKPETLDKALLFLSDVAFNLTLPPEEIENERQVIMEEKRTRAGARQRVDDYVLERLAPGSIFGQRLPIGVEETIRSVTQQDFRDYYSRWYVPSNMAIFVVGDADEALMLDLLRKHFDKGQRLARPADQDIGLVPQTAARGIVATDAEISRASVEIVRTEAPRPPVTTTGRLREQVVEQLALVAFNRRLDQKIARGGMSFLNASLSAGTLSGALRIVQASASGEPGAWRQMLAELGTEVRRAQIHGLSDREVDDARRQLVSSLERAVQTESTRASAQWLGSWDRTLGDGEPITSAQQDLELVTGLLPTIEAREVSRVLTTLIDPATATFVVRLPSNAGVPSESELVQLGLQALSVSPEAETQAARADTLLAQPPSPGAVAEESTHEASAVWSAWLSNGVRVHHRFMDYRKNQVMIQIALTGGELLETAENRGITDAVANALRRPATTTLSSTEIDDLMLGKKAGVGASAQRDALGLSVSGSPEDLETAMQLAYLLLTDPKLEQAAFDQWRTQQLQAIEQLNKSPRGVLTRTLATTIYGENEPRVRPLERENVERLTLSAAQEWLLRHVRTAPIEVAIVGDLPLDRAKDLAQRYLGSLPKRDRVTPHAHPELRRLQRPSGKRVVAKDVDTETKQAQVFAGFYGTDLGNVRDTRALALAAQILTSRMVREVREQEQLVYSIRLSSAPETVFPGFGTVMAGASTDPDKAQRLAEKLMEMYATFAKDGPTPEEMDVVRKQFANTMDERMREPGYWQGRLQLLTSRGQSLDDILGDAPAYQSMTADEIRAVFDTYHDENSLFAVIVTPKAK